MEALDIRNNAYNFLNFLIFTVIYSYIILYQYQLHTPAAYYISMFFDIIFCIYLVNFTNAYIYTYDTLLTNLTLLVIFGFIVLRLISTIVFPYYFLQVERNRKENDCKWSDVPTQIRNLIDVNRISYLYSTVSILLSLFMILFWGKAMNDNTNYQMGLGMDIKAYVGFFLLAAIVAFSIMNTYFTLKFTAVSKRTTICPPKNKTNNEI
tara:strand:- start:515 stop:1138 length:624 start_codon:yes stop_codon:yes gene_type:complete